MRIVFLYLSLFLIICNNVNGATISAKQNGLWTSSSTWDLNRVPADNDIVVIPLAYTVFFVSTPYSKNNVASRPTLDIRIYGILDFSDPGVDKLYLDAGSIIEIFANGKIRTSSGSNEIVAIYNGSFDNTVWTGTPSSVSGPAFATSSTLGFLNGVLAVNFISFDAFSDNNGEINLAWSTSQEYNSSHFEIQLLDPNTHEWSIKGKVEASGNSTQLKSYSYNIAPYFSGMIQVRLKEIDLDGKFIYSAVKTVWTKKSNSIALWFKQGARILHLTGNIPQSEHIFLDIFDMNGSNRMHMDNLNINSTVQIPSLFHGNYVVRLSSHSGTVLSKIVVF